MCGDDRVLSVTVDESNLTVDYGPGWDDYIFSTEHAENSLWKECLKTNTEKLKKNGGRPTKGLGKGKQSE